MKTSELQKKSTDELSAHLVELQQEQFRMRMNKATGQLTRTHRLLEVRREIARTRTVLTQKGK